MNLRIMDCQRSSVFCAVLPLMPPFSCKGVDDQSAGHGALNIFCKIHGLHTLQDRDSSDYTVAPLQGFPG